jgi:hypothetical protein
MSRERNVRSVTRNAQPVTNVETVVSSAIVVMVSVYALVVFFSWLFTN